MDHKNDILCIVDQSYFLYFTVFSAVSEFQRQCPIESAILIKDAELVDQKNLPDLLTSDDFKRILKKVTMKKCEQLDWYLKNRFQDQIDSADRIYFLFAQDDFVKNSFRKELFPAYKAQRKLLKKSFDMFKLHRYIIDVIFKELEVEEKYGYRFLKVAGAEGDDIIAAIAKNFAKDYMLCVLFASDRDFVQLDGISQMTLFGKDVECKIGDEAVTRDEYLGVKILVGDGADNISKVFDHVGVKRALKLYRNKEELLKKLNESADATKQYLLNKKLISFSEIPADLESKIKEEASKILHEEKALNPQLDMRSFMLL